MDKKGEGKTTLTSEQAKSRGVMAGAAEGTRHLPPPYQYQYGTFGIPDYSQPAIGFPQPAPPPGFAAGPAPSAPPYPPPPPPPPPFLHPYPSGPEYYSQGYQAVPGYAAFQEGGPIRLPRLPCFGLGIGWFMFIAGFFLAFPWYLGAFILLCVRVDYREKPGFIACTTAAVLSTIALLLGVGHHLL